MADKKEVVLEESVEIEGNVERVLLGVTEVAGMMGIGRDAAYTIMHSSELPVIKVGRRLLVHKEIFERWLRGEMIAKGEARVKVKYIWGERSLLHECEINPKLIKKR